MAHRDEKYEILLNQVFDLLIKLDEENSLPTNTEPSSSNAGNPTISTKAYPADQHLAEAKNISAEEGITLRQATQSREKGLAALRNNEVERGIQLIYAAANFIKQHTIGPEALLMASTYQYAAEAFIDYKLKAYDKAIQAMFNAIDAHHQLNLNYGHSFGARRIHLARNIARTMSLSGQTEKGFSLSCQLIQYTLIDGAAWPFENQSMDQADVIPDWGKWFVLNQLLEEIANGFKYAPASTTFFVKQLESLVQALDHATTEEFKTIQYWLKARENFAKNDHLTFLKYAFLFFKNREDKLAVAYEDLLDCLGSLVETEEEGE